MTCYLCENIENSIKISCIFFKSFEEYYNIINISTNIISMLFENFIDLSLRICERILIFHDRDIEKFLIAMIYHNKFVTIEKINSSLIKK